MEEGKQFTSPQEEIQYLEQKIIEKRRELADLEPRQVVSETLQEHAAPQQETHADLPPAPSPQDDQKDIIDKRVALYVQHAFENGIADAVREVRNTHNPFLIDSFHDALTDRFLDALRAKGLLETNG